MKKLLIIFVVVMLFVFVGKAQSVCFFQHQNFGGVQYCINRSSQEIGQYSSLMSTLIDNGKVVTRIPSLRNLGGWNDAVSSFKFVGNVESATFYFDDNYRGTYFKGIGNKEYYYVGDLYNDQFSSLVIVWGIDNSSRTNIAGTWKTQTGFTINLTQREGSIGGGQSDATWRHTYTMNYDGNKKYSGKIKRTYVPTDCTTYMGIEFTVISATKMNYRCWGLDSNCDLTPSWSENGVLTKQ